MRIAERTGYGGVGWNLYPAPGRSDLRRVMTVLDACGYRFVVVDAAPSAGAQLEGGLVHVPSPPRLPLASAAAIFRDQPMHAELFQTGDRVEIDLGEFGSFRAGAGARDELQVLRWPIHDSLRDEFLYGPLLLSALAARHVFALHASAFRIGGDDAPVVAVIAPSGTGKSTLARAAHRRGWERLADDLLPTAVDADDGVSVLPHFPQLKLPVDQQYARQRPARVTLAALVVLERSDAIETTAMSPRDTMHTVLTSTISSRLFPPTVLQAHLRFASALATAAAGGSLMTLRLRVRDDRSAADLVADQALSALKEKLDAAGAHR